MAISAQQIQIIAGHLNELARLGDIIYRLRNGYFSPSLYNSDFPKPLEIHLQSSPWVKYGLLMHYILLHHACVAELRRLGIAEDDERVQPCAVPEAPTIHRR